MRKQVLDRPNTFKRTDSLPDDPYHPAPGVQSVSNYRRAHDFNAPINQDIANEEEFYKNIPKNLAGQLVTNSKEAGTFGNTPEFLEALEADRAAHIPMEAADSAARLNALRARAGIGGTPTPAGGSLNGDLNFPGQPMTSGGGWVGAGVGGRPPGIGAPNSPPNPFMPGLPTMNQAPRITGTEAAPTTIGDSIPAQFRDEHEEGTPVGGLEGSNQATGTPSQAMTSRKNSIFRRI